MQYSDTQLAAADLVLKTLLAHKSFANDYLIPGMVKKQYGIKATFVIDMLKDDGLIAQHGQAFLKLTSKLPTCCATPTPSPSWRSPNT